MSERIQTDVLLVGGGIMSATLGSLLTQLDTALHITMVERLPQVAQESSHGWHNAGTGHAGYCELNYTPQQADGSIRIDRALGINAAFEMSLQYWSWLVDNHALPAPGSFISRTPHYSFVWGEKDVAFLHERHARLSAHPLFADMEYSADPAVLCQWMPLVMQQRDTALPLAATRVAYGTDVDFGALTRHLVDGLKQQPQFDLLLGQHIARLKQRGNGHWHVRLRDQASGAIRTLDARFVFLGAGGGALKLLQQSGIPEGKGYGGFPVSGQWLVCTNPDIIRRHHAKVYGQAPLGAPPMSVPHLDTRIIDGKPALLFGPFAGFTTKFLRQGSFLDLMKSVRAGNLKPLLAAGRHNFDLTRYLVREALQNHGGRMAALRRFMPDARDDDWELAFAGKRVQIIKECDEKGGRLEFGTEVVASADGSLAALLGASPGASVSVQTMTGVIERCLAGRLPADWRDRMKAMVPSYGESLIDDAELLQRVRARTLATLGLNTP